jgi:hypothetical protein
MRLRHHAVAATRTHQQCVHLAAHLLDVETDVLPAERDLHLVLHGQVGPNRHWPEPAMYCELPPGQAYLLQRGFYCRPYRVPGQPDETRLQLFGLVSGPSLAHSLGEAQQWFPGGRQLINQALTAHVQGRDPLVITGPCQRPNLDRFYQQIFALARRQADGGSCPVRDIPDDWQLPEDPAITAA